MERYFLQESTELGSAKFFGFTPPQPGRSRTLRTQRRRDRATLRQLLLDQRAEAAVFPHTLIIAEDNANAWQWSTSSSPRRANNALNMAVSNLHAAAGAHVFRKVVQDWNEQTTLLPARHHRCRRDAQVKNLAVNIGAERARYENQTRIEGPGADVKMYSLTVAEEQQEFDQRTFQTHNAPNAVSDLLYKNALLDKSRSIFSGLIKVAEGAQQTDAYQTNRNLLLDPTAEANALPGLEILANDVKCSHGATTGNVDASELFYMMSRGIPKRAAMQLMVFGFFEEVIEKVESDELAENLRTLIRNKFEAKIA
jgi:Fe-S cluster assembly protein SufD